MSTSDVKIAGQSIWISKHSGVVKDLEREIGGLMGLWIIGSDGSERHVQYPTYTTGEAHAALQRVGFREGHRATVFWGANAADKSGRDLLLRNDTTGEYAFMLPQSFIMKNLRLRDGSFFGARKKNDEAFSAIERHIVARFNA